MSQVQELAQRIHAVAKKLNKEPSTISREVLGSGARLAALESGSSSMSFKTYEKALLELSKLEQRAA